MENVLTQKNIVKVVLSMLSEHASIPNDGFLCGGAVANTLMGLSWGGEYPINDLDIFVESKTSKLSSTPTRSDKLVFEEEYRHMNVAYNHGNNYSIISSERDGMINIIKVWRERNLGEYNNPHKDYSYILKGFDFNCTQVGIDLKSGQLLYTPEFEEFLKSKELKVEAPYTPGHTAIRLFKKIDDLGCYCDIDGQMKLLSQPFNNETMIQTSSSYIGVFGMYFGYKYKESYDKYKDKLKPYFKVATLFEHKKWMWERRWEITNQSSRKDVDRNHVLSWLDPDRNPPQNHLNRWAQMNGKVWGLIPIKYDVPDDEFIKVVKYRFSPLILMSVWRILHGGLKKSMIKKVKTVFKYNRLTELCMVNDSFYDCDFDEKGAKSLDDSIYKNMSLGLVIHKYNLNLQESIQLNNDINALLRKEGKWFSELLYKLLLDRGNSFIPPKIDVITKLFEKEKKKLTKPFIEGMDISGLDLPPNVEVKELVSEYDLAYAGRKLKNCINNPGQDYKTKIKKGNTKVFFITTSGSISALELMKKSKKEWVERWTLSNCNKECSTYHRKISNMIQAYCNKELLLESIGKDLKKWESQIGIAKKEMLIHSDEPTTNNKVSHGDLEDLLVDDTQPMDEPTPTITSELTTSDWAQFLRNNVRITEPATEMVEEETLIENDQPPLDLDMIEFNNYINTVGGTYYGGVNTVSENSIGLTTYGSTDTTINMSSILTNDGETEERGDDRGGDFIVGL